MDLERLVAAVDIAVADNTKTVLVEAIRKEPELKSFDREYRVQLPTYTRVLTFEKLAEWLVDRAKHVGARQAVRDVDRFLTAKEIPIWQGANISPIEITRSIILDGAMALVPFREISTDYARDRFLTGADDFAKFQTLAGAALVHLSIWPKEKIFVPENDRNYPRDLARWNELETSVSILAISTGVSVVWSAMWSQMADWVPCSEMAGARPELPPEMYRRIVKTLSLFRGTYARALHQKYWALDEATRNILHVPIERLNRALRSIGSVDSAIDLGIALESIFLSERSDEGGEISFALRVRSARFFGRSPARRRAISILIRDAYSLRSRAVHSGSFERSSRKNKIDPTLCLSRTSSLLLLALRRIIRAGRMPDWDEVTFG